MHLDLITRGIINTAVFIYYFLENLINYFKIIKGPNKKCLKHKWRLLFFTRIKLVARVLVCARAIARIKWRRLHHSVRLF